MELAEMDLAISRARSSCPCSKAAAMAQRDSYLVTEECAAAADRSRRGAGASAISQIRAAQFRQRRLADTAGPRGCCAHGCLPRTR